jgi:hypothetical protein
MDLNQGHGEEEEEKDKQRMSENFQTPRKRKHQEFQSSLDDIFENSAKKHRSFSSNQNEYKEDEKESANEKGPVAPFQRCGNYFRGGTCDALLADVYTTETGILICLQCGVVKAFDFVDGFGKTANEHALMFPLDQEEEDEEKKKKKKKEAIKKPMEKKYEKKKHELCVSLNRFARHLYLPNDVVEVATALLEQLLEKEKKVLFLKKEDMEDDVPISMEDDSKKDKVKTKKKKNKKRCITKKGLSQALLQVAAFQTGCSRFYEMFHIGVDRKSIKNCMKLFAEYSLDIRFDPIAVTKGFIRLIFSKCINRLSQKSPNDYLQHVDTLETTCPFLFTVFAVLEHFFDALKKKESTVPMEDDQKKRKKKKRRSDGEDVLAMVCILYASKDEIRYGKQFTVAIFAEMFGLTHKILTDKYQVFASTLSSTSLKYKRRGHTSTKKQRQSTKFGCPLFHQEVTLDY